MGRLNRSKPGTESKAGPQSESKVRQIGIEPRIGIRIENGAAIEIVIECMISHDEEIHSISTNGAADGSSLSIFIEIILMNPNTLPVLNALGIRLEETVLASAEFDFSSETRIFEIPRVATLWFSAL
ncbi:hypothetical protein EVAR_18018_1 [Eumeta japonica]|uniref:Uncharacterized protein n=1 Tax=Eumeta variegata TaxID=151549 RepID=A0A4C1ZKE3_EUMVA|nr:hypothetical protein EVAR_18018_1 [Eumeta japonica]